MRDAKIGHLASNFPDRLSPSTTDFIRQLIEKIFRVSNIESFVVKFRTTPSIPGQDIKDIYLDVERRHSTLPTSLLTYKLANNKSLERIVII